MKAFQLRSRAVRAASQELMRRLREERGATSRHKPKPLAVARPAEPAASPTPASEIKPSRKIIAAAVDPPVAKAVPGNKAHEAKPRKLKQTAKASARPAATAMPVHEPAPQTSAAGTKKSRVRKPMAGPVATLQQALAETFQAAGAAIAVASSRATEPVSAIPTLGPGMVWRLKQLGVATLGDLAAQEPEALRHQLGRLGRIVNVEQWITYAKSA
jgi:hypothetical protein